MALLAATPRRKTCLPRTALIALLTVLGLLVAAPAGAQQARHVRLVIDETFTHAHLSEVCGTEILESREATLNVTILYNKEGLIAKEIDPAGGGTITYVPPRRAIPSPSRSRR